MIKLHATGWVALTLFLAPSALLADSKSDPGKDTKDLADRIDRHIEAGWRRHNVKPADPADDATYLRRVYLDLVGQVPGVYEVRDFLDDSAADKRDQLVQRLLNTDAYARNYSAVFRKAILPGNVQVPERNNDLEVWFHEQLKNNVGYDRIARAVLTGDPLKMPYAAFADANEKKPENLATSTSRFFMGVRLECAQCHNHPFAKWKKEQFWELVAFFSAGQAAIPDSDKVVTARLIIGDPPDLKNKGDLRQVLADLLTKPENPYFARAAVNRIWMQFFGLGLAEPVDSLGEDEPPSHPELLDDLADDFIKHDYDLRFLIRAITSSKTYGLSSMATDPSQDDPRLFARAAIRGLTAQQLYDSLAIATGKSSPLVRGTIRLSAILAALAVATDTKAAVVPFLLLSTTVGMAHEFSTHGTAPVQITSLLHKVTTEMFIKKLKLFAVCFITLTFVAGGTALFTRRADTDRLTAASATSASRETYPDSSFAASRSPATQAPVPVADKDDSKEKPVDKPAWKAGAKGCSPRYAHSAVWDPKHEKMIVFGGSIRKGDSFDYYNDVWTYSPAKDEWKEVEVKDKTRPDERAYHACAWDSKRNQMWIYGGGNSAFEGWTDLWMFDPETAKWTGMDPGDTHPRGRLGATLHYYPPADSLILIGGSEGFTGNEAAVHEVWFYSITDKKWTEKKNNAPHRWLAAATLDAKNGLITLFGGIDDQSQVHDETYVYDIDKDKWSDAVKGKRITNSLPAVWDAEQARMIVCAGTCPGVDKTAYDDVFTFDPQKKAWTELAVDGKKPESRAYHSAVWVPELHSMIVFGGTTNQFSDPSVENKVWTLRLPAK